MRELIKKVVRGVALAAVSPLAGIALLGKKLGTGSFFMAYAQLLSLLPGVSGTYLRVAYYRMTLKRFGKDSRIAMGSTISKMETSVGNDTYIGANTSIGWATIGDKTVISNRVSILSGKRMHNFTDPTKGPCEGPDNFVRVTIGDRSFVGDQSVVMADVGEASIVAAGCIVIHPVEDYVVVAGNPAHVVKKRI